MNIRPQRKEELNLNLTPLIDVVFLLLIFFMVTTTFTRTTDLDIELPKVSHVPVQPPPGIELGIDKNGQYYVQGELLQSRDPEVLKKVLKATIKDKMEDLSTLSVIIRGDQEAPHQAVVTALDVSGQLGIKQLKIMANNKNV